jgi:Mor family transcriptional regulator
MIINNFYLYFHYRLDTDEVFYIGKGKGRRAYNKEARNLYWKRIVDKVGYKVEIVQDNISEWEALMLEMDMISLYKKMGYNLANFTWGGQRGPTGHKMSAITRKKKSEAVKGEKHPQYGKPRSRETKEKLSKIAKEQFKDPTVRKKQAEYAKLSGGHRVPHSEETKLKLSKPYPCFINSITNEVIPSGTNLKALCEKYGLTNANMYKVINGQMKAHKGWRLYNA